MSEAVYVTSRLSLLGDRRAAFRRCSVRVRYTYAIKGPGISYKRSCSHLKQHEGNSTFTGKQLALRPWPELPYTSSKCSYHGHRPCCYYQCYIWLSLSIVERAPMHCTPQDQQHDTFPREGAADPDEGSGTRPRRSRLAQRRQHEARRAETGAQSLICACIPSRSYQACRRGVQLLVLSPS